MTDFRAVGKDDSFDLLRPVRVTLDKVLAYIDDELVEDAGKRALTQALS